MSERLLSFPLILILTGISGLMMFLPAIDGLMRGDMLVARVFFNSGVLGIMLTLVIGLAMSGPHRRAASNTQNLFSLLLAYLLLPFYLAVPFSECVNNTTYLNVWFEMVSSLTTTGATLYDAPGRIVDTLHLWRALVGWGGGLLIWVSASAVLAPLNLGGFEVTARAEPGQGDTMEGRFERAKPARRLAQAAATLGPVYIGLTGALWIILMMGGERAFVALIHAMSTMATSGISSIGGVQNGASGFAGEFAIFLFLLFALSRLTFSSDLVTTARPGVIHDPEFRLGVLLVLGVPLVLLLRHWIAALDVADVRDPGLWLRSLWGGMFTVLSFLSTAGFQSADWQTARAWSGLGTPGLTLLGLSLMGGGVATTAGGVKLLRVYALYLHGRREVERLVYPSSVGRNTGLGRRIRRQGAYIAWIFFMLFAMSVTVVTALLGLFGQDFEAALILTISGLSTTGPLVQAASETPIRLIELSAGAKIVYAVAMVLGRLETLALIALLNPAVWRD
ncbi:MAG: potassium transporter TrkH [Rhodobacteraceae bacterium CG17_big_fil_post_rev_8_21_14_2_50_63_15]|nr:TrkH family potassium uptake protein [Roseovarius sp.]PIV77029.1 MAG: potassium transporter TrkH [Rhodobacteraceae bacterium CG17_big_fil_post_rev_8_21_14_2_50_63_15]